MASKNIDVEWMFGDCATGALGINALASYNPLRWSGSLDFVTAIKQMEDVRNNKEEGRPIIVKIPSGITTAEVPCKNVEEAIQYIKSKSPEEKRKIIENMEAEEKKKALLEEVDNAKKDLAAKQKILEDEEPAAKAAQEAYDTERAKVEGAVTPPVSWKYRDTGSALGAFGKFFAQLDPNRWSGDRTMHTCYEELEAMVKDDEKEAERSICCKMTHEGKEDKKDFKISEAIVYMKVEVEKGDKTLQPLEQANLTAKERVKNATENVEKAKQDVADAEERAKKGGAINAGYA